jgi:hypothetical protein
MRLLYPLLRRGFFLWLKYFAKCIILCIVFFTLLALIDDKDILKYAEVEIRDGKKGSTV